MIDIKLLREKPDYIKEAIRRKGYKIDIDEILEIDKRRRALIQETEEFRHSAKEISALGKDASEDDREKGRSLKEKIKVKEKELDVVESDLSAKFSQIPNPAFDEVPEGEGDKGNKELRVVGNIPEFSFKPKDHLELAERLGIVDFEAGAKVAGSQFFYLKNEGAMLELAIITYTLDLLREEGFEVLFTPDMARSKYYLGTGYLPKGEKLKLTKLQIPIWV